MVRRKNKKKRTIMSLPGELIDLVVSYVGEPRCEWEGNLDERSLRNLCLTNKFLLPHARRALYGNPFHIRCRQGNGTRAQRRSILESLQANKGKLGKLVRGTDGIEVWIELGGIILEAGGPGSWSELETWYLDVLRACPRLTSTQLILPSERMLRLTLRAINPSLPTIKDLQIFGRHPLKCSDPPLKRSTAFEALNRSFTRPLRLLEFMLTITWTQDLNEPLPQLTIQAVHLNLNSKAKLPSDALPFIPVPNSQTPLRILAIHFYSTAPVYDTNFISSIGKLHGPNLKQLTVRMFPQIPVDFESYRKPSNLLPLSSDDLKYFPGLKMLGFNCSRGPSLRFLQKLSTHCPLLESICFGGSRWITSDLELERMQDPEQTSTLTPENLFPEREVFEAYKKFKHLTETDFGFLPTNSKTRYEKLRQKLADHSGAIVQYDVCERDPNFFNGRVDTSEEEEEDSESESDWTTDEDSDEDDSDDSDSEDSESEDEDSSEEESSEEDSSDQSEGESQEEEPVEREGERVEGKRVEGDSNQAVANIDLEDID
ncbi:hypothetical protein JCM3765_003822 [Sporobolomyces pararoseus]